MLAENVLFLGGCKVFLKHFLNFCFSTFLSCFLKGYQRYISFTNFKTKKPLFGIMQFARSQDLISQYLIKLNTPCQVFSFSTKYKITYNIVYPRVITIWFTNNPCANFFHISQPLCRFSTVCFNFELSILILSDSLNKRILK